MKCDTHSSASDNSKFQKGFESGFKKVIEVEKVKKE